MNFEKFHDTWSIDKIRRLISNRKINLNPGFQRLSVWTENQQKLLINSILSEMPLPNIFLWERKEGKKIIYDVIDGKQRIESIIAFTRYRKPIAVSIDSEGQNNWKFKGQYEWKWKEICDEETSIKRTFNNYKIPVVLIKGTLASIESVFIRINSTGKTLTKQEIRKAKWRNSPLLIESEKLAAKYERVFISYGILSAGQISRMKAVELVSELLLSIMREDVLDKKKALDTIFANDNVRSTSLAKASRELSSIINLIKKRYEVLRETRMRRPSDFYAFVFCLWKMKRDGYVVDDISSIQRAVEILKLLSVELAGYTNAMRKGEIIRLSEVSRRYRETVSYGTDSARNRRDRVKIIEKLIRNGFKGKDFKRGFTDEQKQILWHGTKDKICSFRGCKKKLTWDDVEIDHVAPHSRGGTTSLKNGQIMCRKHNRVKSNKIKI